MIAQEYILSQLQRLAEPAEVAKPLDDTGMVEAIVGALLSRKFRKYAVGAQLREHIYEAVRLNVAAGEPINLTFLNRAYKLWRLEESPEVDWAEFFTVIHYSNWVRPICALYRPGVWFDFLEDDLIVPKLNHMTIKEVDEYLTSFQKLLDFLREFQPRNLRMTLTRVGSLFDSAEAFNASLERNVARVSASLPGGLPELTDRQLAMIELNVRTTPEETKDSKWREKLYMVHDGYALTKREPGYHYTPTKILVFTQPLPNGMVLAVGTARSSVAKFWVGVGALVRKGAAFYPTVLSPSQLRDSKPEWETTQIEGLRGKNFSRIRVLD